MAFWGEYVSAAERRAQSARELKKLEKKGVKVQPVEISGRSIARSFWGKGWCDHLESFSDYSNRLPRGRTYVRNGSVCHLEVRPQTVEAMVCGTSLYTVRIEVNPLPDKVWEAVKAACAGQIGSLLELLQGRLSERVMEVVSDRRDGLFPKPREIAFTCSCPDRARMCKHVAAVLYGVGSRLDREPELLFLLRGVDPQELLAVEFSSSPEGDEIPDERLSEIFGIDLEFEFEEASEPPREEASFARGAEVRALRERLGLGVNEFARQLGVTAASVRRWEGTESLGLRERSLRALRELAGGCDGGRNTHPRRR